MAGIEQQQIFRVPKIKDRQAAVDTIMSWGSEASRVRYPNARASFEDYYQHWGELGKKYAIAEALIESPRRDEYDPSPSKAKVRRLLDAFIPPEMDLEGDAKKEAEELRFGLQLLLLKHHLLDGGDPEAQSAVLSFVERNEMLNACMGMLPLPVMSALVTVEMYKDTNDAEKVQKYMNNNARSLLSDYLRVTATPRTQEGLDFSKLFVQLPDQIFEDSNLVAWQIVQDYFVSQAINLFRDDPTGKEAFPKLDGMIATAKAEQNNGKYKFLTGIRKEFEQIDSLVVPQSLKREVEGWEKQSFPFPVFRQKYFAHEFAKTNRKLLMGDTGATKTASSYLAMEHVGAKRVTIFGPAKARDTWKMQAAKHFRDESGKVVFTVESERDLQDPLVKSADYVFISNALLARQTDKRDNLIKLLVQERGTDGIIIDEAHTFKNEETHGTTMLAAIVAASDKHYGDLHQGAKPLPIIELTATPISNSIEDLDVLLGVLYPDRFGLPGSATESKNVFSKYALRDPKLAYTLLFGEKLLIQWSSQDIFGSKIPELRPEREIVSLRPYERVIYEWMANVPIDPLRKINVLINLLLNPNLIKESARKNGWAIADIPPVATLQERFDTLYTAWQKWETTKPSAIPTEPFSADWIAKFVNEDDYFLVHAFFSPELKNGVFSLAEAKVAQDRSFATHWESPETPSTKYGALKDIIAEKLPDSPDGKTPKKTPKFFVVSPFRRGAITGNVNPNQEGMEDMESLFSQMREWFPNVDVLRVDGTQDFAKRREIANQWTADTAQSSVCIASMQSVFESGDWSVKESQHTSEINVIFLGWPWGWDDFKQMSGRFLRPGLAVPVNIHVLENDDTIDLGFQALVRRKHLLTQMALYGVQLDRDDQQFFNESLAAGNILASQRESQLFYVRETYRRLKGRGEVALKKELTRQIEGGRINADRIAEFYYGGGMDEFRTVGFNAQHVANITLEKPVNNILSVGAGTCLFARKMRAAGYTGRIVNYDMNQSKLAIAAENHPEILRNGENIVGVASNMEDLPSDTFDAVESSYMLDLTTTKNGDKAPENPVESERVKALLEMRRVTKPGGRILITLPDKAFKDGKDFIQFTNALETHFGLNILSQSGRATASDGVTGAERTYTKHLGWIITAEKVATEPSFKDFDITALEFSTDPDVVIREKNGRRKQNGVELNLPEFKLVSPNVFEIVNPMEQAVYRSQSTPRAAPQATQPGQRRAQPTETAEELYARQVDEIHLDLRTMDKNAKQRKLYNKLRSEIAEALREQQILSTDGNYYEDAQRMLDDIIIRMNLELPGYWTNLNDIRRRIEPEYRRAIRRLK